MSNRDGMEIFPLFSKLVGIAKLNLSPADLKKAQTLIKKYKFSFTQASIKDSRGYGY